MSSNNNFNRKVADFFDKKGFYIVLLCCIGVVVATIIFINSYENNPQNESGIYDEGTDMDVDSSYEQDDVDIVTPDEDEGDISTISTDIPSEDNTQPVSRQVQTVRLAKPVSGDILKDYSMDQLVYSLTLDEWRTHSGINLAAELGTPVKAAADGVVLRVENDLKYGMTVVIEHTPDFKTVYSNLASGNLVSPNQRVSRGEVIGVVGDTTLYQSIEQSHLFFEVLLSDKYVDPKLYLD